MNIKDFSNKLENAHVVATMCQAGAEAGLVATAKPVGKITPRKEGVMVRVTMNENNIKEDVAVLVRARRILENKAMNNLVNIFSR